MMMSGLPHGLSIEEALRYVEARRTRGFLIHAGIYAAVIAGLSAVRHFKRDDGPHVVTAALGWGIGVAAHGLRTFGRSHRR